MRGSVSTTPKKVAILLPSMQVGGAERLVLEELSCLRGDPQFAVEVHLVFEEGPLFQSVAALGTPVHVWNAPHKSLRMVATFAAIIAYLRRTRCDILHTHLLDWIGPVVGRIAGTRVVATVHSDKQYRATERFALAQSDLVLACGKQVMKNIVRFIPAEKVTVLSNAIGKPDNGSFRRDSVREAFGINKESKLVVSLGRLTRAKGYDVLIEAFRRVTADMPEAVLVIGGDGEEKERLTDSVESAGLGSNVKLPGMVRDIHGLLAASDIYVNSSRREGLPMTLLEAMAHGKPTVATNVGGNAEVVHAGITGILVPPEDPERLAEALIRMLRDGDLRVKAGARAMALFDREFTIDKHCTQLKEYYRSVLQLRRLPGQ
jgi:glycosyltransferase involved in cell wall biosynthesis